MKPDRRFGLLSVTTKKITNFLDVTRCSLVDRYHTTPRHLPQALIMQHASALLRLFLVPKYLSQHSRDSSVGRDGLRARRPGFDSRQRQEIVLYSVASMTAVEPR
jgi:hypothetical protein